MFSRSALVIAPLLAASCSLGGTTIGLGDAPNGAAGAGGHAEAGATSTDAGGGGGLIIDAGPMEVSCAGGKQTSISGTVYDPAGKVPLYNAVVFVPNAPLPPFKNTVDCEKCKDQVPARAATLSDANGHFLLEDVPAGAVDLVVQVGKWRRMQRISVKACEENVLTESDLTRLPRSKAEGDIPKIALSTGHSDALECLLRKMGIADSEFTTDAGDGRVNLFVGCAGDQADKHTGASKLSPALGGDNFPSTNWLFDAGELNRYDVVIFSCEGHKCDSIQTPTNVSKLVEFANKGGRVFLDHDHYNWLNHANVPIESAAQFSSSPDDIPSPLATQINRSFPKGKAFAQWLLNVGASSTLGALDIYAAKTSVQSLSPNRAQSWIFRSEAPTGFFYFTIGTPVAVQDDDPAPEACGRVVFTDLHVSKSGGGRSSDFSDQDTPFPAGCTTLELSAQEKALEFMLLDLTSCVQQDTATPTPPIIVK